MGAGFELAAGNVKLPAGARRDQLQLRDQRLREVPAVGTRRALAAGEADLSAIAGQDQLQQRDEHLQTGPALEAGLALAAGDVCHSASAWRSQLQLRDQRLSRSPACAKGQQWGRASRWLQANVTTGSATTNACALALLDETPPQGSRQK